MKKVLFTFLCTALLVSCASQGTVLVDSTITEATILKALAQANGTSDLALADSLVANAEKQKKEKQTTAAYLLADEAVLQYQIALQKQENKNIADSLAAATESLKIYSNALATRKSVSGK